MRCSMYFVIGILCHMAEIVDMENTNKFDRFSVAIY